MAHALDRLGLQEAREDGHLELSWTRANFPVCLLILRRDSMSRLLLLVPVAVGFGLLMPNRAAAEPHNPRLHHALYEMKEAYKQLQVAGDQFHGHKDSAMKGLDAAIRQTEKALAAVGDPYVGFTPPAGIYRGYANYAHIRHSLVVMNEARNELKNAPHDFKGHRDLAVHYLDYAILEIDKCLK
jgi:hypothetical protein